MEENDNVDSENFESLKDIQKEKDISVDNLFLDKITKKTKKKEKIFQTKIIKKNSFSDNDDIKINKKNNFNEILNNNLEEKFQKLENSENYINPNSDLNYNQIYEMEKNSANIPVGITFNNNYQNFLLPEGIQDPKLIHNLILFMDKDLKNELKYELSITLSKTKDSIVLQKFLELNGSEILSKWLQDIKDKLSFSSNSNTPDNILNNTLLNILKFCEKLQISLFDLKYSKIGKIINKIGKCVNDREIQSKCLILVNKWKRIVEDIREKKVDIEKEKKNFNLNVNKTVDEENLNVNNLHKGSDLLNKKKHLERTNNDKIIKKYIIILFKILKINFKNILKIKIFFERVKIF